MYIVSYRSKGLWRAGILSDSVLMEAATLNPAVYRQPYALFSKRSLHLLVNCLNRHEMPSDESEQLIPLEKVELGPPVPDPEKIIAWG